MKQALTTAMTPYLLAFLRKPQLAQLDVTVSTDGADAVLTMATSDFNELQGDSSLRGHLSRCYNELCRRLDDALLPTLIFRSTGTRAIRGRKPVRGRKPHKGRKPGKGRKKSKGHKSRKGRKSSKKTRARKK